MGVGEEQELSMTNSASGGRGGAGIVNESMTGSANKLQRSDQCFTIYVVPTVSLQLS